MKLELAAIFSDGCVLQENKEIAIFGKAESGKTVYASLEGVDLKNSTRQISKGEVLACDGEFIVYLPPLNAGLNHTLTISCDGENITRSNIAIGEVWLAGGQSNMEFELCNCTEKDVLEKPANSMIRFYYTQKKSYIDHEFLEEEAKTHWECFGDEGTKHWSAVGYFFAERLLDNLNVPVGIIGCNWGGTSASNWISYSDIEEDNLLQVYLQDYKKETEGKSLVEQKKDFEEYSQYKEWFDKEAEALYEKEPDIEWDEVERRLGSSRYPGPINSYNPYRPGGLYECMLSRISPYTLKGFLYYQGESDDHQPELYQHLFTKLIKRWRIDFKDNDLPFVYALLPMHRYKRDPDFKNWCIIRQAQIDTQQKVHELALTDIIDQGVYDDIHPKSKRVVGRRMCAVALQRFYNIECGDGLYPYAGKVKCTEEAIEIQIENGEGLHSIEQPSIKRINYTPFREGSYGFELVCKSGDILQPDIQISNDRIIIDVSKIREEVAEVRYLWTNYGDVLIYNKAQMPLIPFREIMVK